MSVKQPWYHSILFILVIALAVRLLAAGYWQSRLEEGQTFRFGDSDGYWQLSARIANGEPYEYNSEHAKVFRTPGYPIFLSPLFWFWPEPPVMVARVVGSLCGVISVWLTWLIALRLFSPFTARYAAWLVCLYPGAVAISILVLAEALFVPIMLGQFLAMAYAYGTRKESIHFRWVVLSGILNGLACLTRPSWILFLPFMTFAGLIFFGDRKKQALFFLVSIVCTCLVMMPWWIRNYQVTGRFVLTSLQTGTSLYDGLNPDATGASDMQFAPVMKKELLKKYSKQNIGPDNEFEYWFNEQMKQRSLSWAWENPNRVLALSWIKFQRIWNPMPNANEIGSSTIRWGIALFFIPSLLLAFAGIYLHRRNYLAMAICLFPTVYFTLLHMVFVGSIRYRQPPFILLLILSGSVLAFWLGQKEDSKASEE